MYSQPQYLRRSWEEDHSRQHQRRHVADEVSPVHHHGNHLPLHTGPGRLARRPVFPLCLRLRVRVRVPGLQPVQALVDADQTPGDVHRWPGVLARVGCECERGGSRVVLLVVVALVASRPSSEAFSAVGGTAVAAALPGRPAARPGPPPGRLGPQDSLDQSPEEEGARQQVQEELWK